MSEESQMNLHKKRHYQQAYHEFQTERQSTSHSFDSYSTFSLKSSRDSPSNSLTTTIEFHINNPIRQLLAEFKEMLKAKGFKCTQIFQNQLYLVRLKTMDKIRKLFGCIEPPKYLLSIRTHEYRSVRVVSIKPVKSSQLLRQPSSTMNEAEQLLHYLSCSRNLNKPLTNEQLNELDSEYKQDIYSLDATANYMFSKMLVDTNYSIGKRIMMIVNQVKNFKSLDEIKISEMVWISSAIGQIAQQMLEGFNCSRKELYQILCYCRKSIQNYLYSTLEQTRAQNQAPIHHSLLHNPSSVVPEKDLPSHEQTIKNQSFFIALYPVSIKQLKLLMSCQISIEIFERLFLLNEFVKIETQTNKIEDELKNDFLQWIKEDYLQKVSIKVKVLQAAGFPDKTFHQILKQLKIEE